MKTSGFFTLVRYIFTTIIVGLPVIGLFTVGRFRPKTVPNTKAICLINQRNFQQAVRSYADKHSLKIGDPIDWTKIMGPGNYIEQVRECPIHGTSAYDYSTTVPPIGTLAAPCKDPAHKPPNIEEW
jgi:hypothetical protein